MIEISKKITGYAVRKPGHAVGTSEPSESVNEHFIADADRRLKIEGCPVPPTASLRWEKRPVLPQGNPGMTYVVDSPEGRFAVFVGHIPNGSPETGYPFEVWANGEEAPRGLSAVAKSLSVDMRSQDRAWLRRKLEALAKTEGQAFQMTMPGGKVTNVPSAVAAFAQMVLHRCEELGAFSDEKLTETPVLNALMSKREPKTTADGSMAWYADVVNPATGDDLVLVLKEAVLDGGQRRPFSLWFSGKYPKSLDGLAKSLSLDVRVVEPAWIGRKLRQLADSPEARGEFFAEVPNGAGKKRMYPSTVAYIAALVLHRFVQLGLLTEDGVPTVDNGVVQLSEARAMRDSAAQHMVSGRDCAACGSVGTVVRMDGCDICTSCSDSKCG